ncbi:hypothetical protein [uncultured Arcobacter sp.]|uniref:hypothetical protein n=1 Tax=uncultured Arcobacter sp. TaxID=165434 RepID=UPI002625579E|nr:hypothetical protein [uncultured Arcobacter sp.]
MMNACKQYKDWIKKMRKLYGKKNRKGTIPSWALDDYLMDIRDDRSKKNYKRRKYKKEVYDEKSNNDNFNSNNNN